MDLAGLDRTAAGAVDAQDDALGVLVLEGILQALAMILSALSSLWRDHPLQIDQRGMPAGQRRFDP